MCRRLVWFGPKSSICSDPSAIISASSDQLYGASLLQQWHDCLTAVPCGRASLEVGISDGDIQRGGDQVGIVFRVRVVIRIRSGAKQKLDKCGFRGEVALRRDPGVVRSEGREVLASCYSVET